MTSARIILGLIGLLVSFVAVAEIYKWTDANGVVHYGDRPAQASAQRLPIKDKLPKPKPAPVKDEQESVKSPDDSTGENESAPSAEAPNEAPSGNAEGDIGAEGGDTESSEETKPEEEEKKPTVYTAFAISSPGHNGTVRSAPGNVAVSLRVSPPLDRDFKHSVRIRLDNRVVASGASTSFGLDNVDRGTHRLSAELLDENKRVLRRARTITFHLHR
ncbi:MAG: DUF4124 domain-containing protein [Gammaproteobacteria bacterium]